MAEANVVTRTASENKVRDKVSIFETNINRATAKQLVNIYKL